MKSIQNSTSKTRRLSESAIYWADKAFKKTNLTKSHFAEILCQTEGLEHLFEQTSDSMPADVHAKKTGKNFKKVQRFLSYESPIPADILISWANALPSPYCEYLKREMADTICPNQMDTSDILVALREINEAAAALAGGNPDAIRKELSEAIVVMQKILGELS